MGLVDILFSIPEHTARADENTIDDKVLGGRFEQTPKQRSVSPIVIPNLSLKAPERAGEVRFILNDIKFIDATSISEDTLKNVISDYLSQEITLSDLYKMADLVTNEYRQNGFALSFALVPAQEIMGGIASLQIVEGFINEVTFEGSLKGSKVDGSKRSNRLTEDRPLRLGELEKFIYGLETLPGLDVKTVLQASDNVARSTDITVIGNQSAYDVSLAINNRGSEAIGPIQAYASASFYSLFSDFDRIQVLGAITPDFEELNYISANYRVPISVPALMFEIGGAFSDSEPGSVLDQFDIVSNSASGYALLDWHIWKTRSVSAKVTGRFIIKTRSPLTLGTQFRT